MIHLSIFFFLKKKKGHRKGKDEEQREEDERWRCREEEAWLLISVRYNVDDVEIVGRRGMVQRNMFVRGKKGPSAQGMTVSKRISKPL